jgi:hypothetical protein
MSLLETINKDDIAKVISYSQDIQCPRVDTLLTTWASRKNRIAQRFLNGLPIYSYPNKVRFELSADSQKDRFESFIDYLWNIFNNEPHPLIDFLNEIGFNTFYQNSLNQDYIIKIRDNKKILKGTKVIKSFKYFIADQTLLCDLQNKASELIQENKIEGYIHFSIHPLDFLSSSENNYNWRSCHSLDGEFRAGNLSYMNDSSTMMVYLTSGKEEKLPHFPEDVPWNSKKWRVLLHFDKNLEVCFAGRQYPFFSPGALDVVKTIFTETLCPTARPCSPWELPRKEQWDGWYNDYVEQFLYTSANKVVDLEFGKYCVINRGIFNINSIVKDAPDSKHFNDVLRSSYYSKPYYMFKHYWTPSLDIDIMVGSEVKCLHCEENIINGQDSMMCSECECKYGHSDSDSYQVCECCGARHWYENGTWVNDSWLCDNCIETETFVCDECGCREYNSNQRWDEENSRYICDYCMNDMKGEHDNG